MTMTREEAIERLKQNKAAAEFYAGMVQNTNAIENELKDIEAIDMAIDALKTEPIRCGECENYIDSRCIEANHHVAAHGNCMNVFGAKRREL